MRKRAVLAAMLAFVFAGTPALAQDDDPNSDHYDEGVTQGQTGGDCTGSGSYYNGCVEGQNEKDYWDREDARHAKQERQRQEEERQRQEQFQRELDEPNHLSDCALTAETCPP